MLHADSLELRRLHCDILMYFKILHNKLDTVPDNYFTLSHNTHTRGNAMKLMKPPHFTCLTLGQFNTRAIDVWNSLPTEMVNCFSVSSFKSMLNNVNFSHYCKSNLA